MYATTYKSLRGIFVTSFLYLCCITSVLKTGTPVVHASVETSVDTGASLIKIDLYGNTSLGNLTCEFSKHNVDLTLDVPYNVTLYIEGEVEDDVTLMFSDDKHIMDPIPNVTLSPETMKNATEISLLARNVGKTVLITKALPGNMTDVSKAFVRVVVPYSKVLDYVSDAVGWLYFVAWSISFYPQTFSNWRRKSVIGLHFDFLSLNTLGFFLYSVFNICLHFIPYIENQYYKHHPHGVNPVQLNDVIFSIHAFFACIIQIIQCLIYDRGDQQVSKTAKSILSSIGLLSVVMVILGAAAVVSWLNFLYYLSYVKLFITLIKYIPQAYYNYRRKSTSGWSIGNILLDFTGGLLSIAQMFILSFNYSDWGSIFGDPTKFGLGLFSIIFDIFFMVQHYVLYRGNASYQRIPASPPHGHVSPLTESAASSVDYGSTSSVY
ncbi:hypothetical protein SK128_010426 [Halocaridina rubra]|uniref:Cystinosin n=1 Tax=Halocaridina rubra TaxID=373956 RepID=A0AAN8XDP3_HALRR